MTNKRYALRDDQWERIKDLLPGLAGQPGATAKHNRLFVDAVLYRYRAGIPWQTIIADKAYDAHDRVREPLLQAGTNRW